MESRGPARELQQLRNFRIETTLAYPDLTYLIVALSSLRFSIFMNVTKETQAKWKFVSFIKNCN